MASSSFWISTEDWHTAGEPFRIVENLPAGYLPDVPTVAERRAEVVKTPEHPLNLLRQSLCHEPRGHADMYGGFIMPPNDSGAHFGVLFWHKDGFSTACGHGTIALGYWALSRGLVGGPDGDGEVDIVVDVPSGRVVAKMVVKNGKPVHAIFVNVCSFQFASPLSVTVESIGKSVIADLGFAGAAYASVNAAELGLKVEPSNADRFISLAREIKALLGKKAWYGDYYCYGVIFFEDEGDEPGIVRQRNVTVYAEGAIDRSPCGSGTSARLALLLAQGRVGPGIAKLVHRSIIATEFEADVVTLEKNPVQDLQSQACVPRVKGTANLVGRMNFFIDPSDPIYPGFLLR